MLRKTITFVILFAILFSSFSLLAFAEFLPDYESASVDSYVLYNLENDMIMAEKGLGESIPLSSTAKIMTACVALESGISFESRITITPDMIKNVSGRFMGLKVGDVLTFEDLLYATVCASFNDAAQALALTVAPTLDDFVYLMNSKAQSLGMSSTAYNDVTGLDGEALTTIGDVLKLARYMSASEVFLKITSTKSYRFSSIATCDYTTVTNRSTLLATYKGISNFNSGSSGGHGFSAVHYYEKNGLSFIVIVMNAKAQDEDDKTNYAEQYTKQLLSHAFNDYSKVRVLDSQKSVASLSVNLSISNDEIKIYPKADLELFLPDAIDISNDLTYEIDIWDGELTAPLRVGETIGVIVVSHNGKLLGTMELVVKEDVERNSFLFVLDAIKNFVTSRLFILIILFAVMLFGVFYFNKTNRLNKMYKKRKRYKK